MKSINEIKEEIESLERTKNLSSNEINKKIDALKWVIEEEK